MTIIPQVYAAESKQQIGESLSKGIIVKPSATGIFRENGSIHWGLATQYVLNVMFFIAALGALFFMVWGGINILTSAGDKPKLETGRNRLMFAVIGLIVVVSAYAVWRLVLRLLGVTQLTFEVS